MCSCLRCNVYISSWSNLIRIRFLLKTRAFLCGLALRPQPGSIGWTRFYKEKKKQNKTKHWKLLKTPFLWTRYRIRAITRVIFYWKAWRANGSPFVSFLFDRLSNEVVSCPPFFMQCPEIISRFPEIFSSLPIPGKISILPEKFCCSPETGLVWVVIPRGALHH